MDAGFRASLLVCGLSQAQADALAQEGYLTYEDFSLSRYEDISDMPKRVQALSVAHGGVHFGHMHIVKMKAFLFWLKDRQRRDQQLNPGAGGFGQAELTQAITHYQAELEMKAAEVTKARIPEKFSPHSLHGWNTFNQELQAYLSSVQGIAWMREVKNEECRMAMQKLREHHAGAATRSRRVHEALEKLKICHYKSEKSFSFDKYVTTLKDCFATLEEDDRGRTDKDKVDQLLNGIQCTQLSAAVSKLNMNEAMHADFEMAATLLQRAVHRVFPFAQGKNKRGVSKVNAADGDGTEEEVRYSARNYSVRGRVTFSKRKRKKFTARWQRWKRFSRGQDHH